MHLFVEMESKRMVQNPRPSPPINAVHLVRSILNQHDSDCDNRLDKAELKEAFKTLGATIPGWRAMRGLHYADVNGDGYISQDEMSCLVNYAIKNGYIKD